MKSPKKTPYIAETFAVADSAGQRLILRHWKYKIEFQMLDGSTSVTHAGWKIDSTEGRHVNQAQDGTLTFADTGEVLTRL